MCFPKFFFFYHMQLLAQLVELKLGNQNELQSMSNNKQLSVSWH